MLVSMADLLKSVHGHPRAIGAFNATSLESVQAIVGAAQEQNTPVILQFATGHQTMILLEDIAPIMKHFAQKATVDIALHLDHGESIAQCMQAIDLGFTSVMIDASAQSFDENVRQTSAVVDYAHSLGVSVEAELGHMATSAIVVGEGSGVATDLDHIADMYTDPMQAKDFVSQTNVDALAVAFGTVHGIYLQEPSLDIERLHDISQAVGIPLVMHGGSGVSPTDYQAVIANGICKVNYYTYLNQAGGQGLRDYVCNHQDVLFHDQANLYCMDVMKQHVKKAMTLFEQN